MKEGKKKVYCNGVFDLFHRGHVHYLEEAAKLGQLYVGVHSDQDATQYKRVPIMTYDERCSVVRACRFVHQVIPDTDLAINEKFIKQHGIDVVVCSAPDVRWHADPMRLNCLHVIESYAGISTTDIIQRIRTRE